VEVLVFLYGHRHGHDISVYVSEELAVAEGARIARQWWSQARDRDASLPGRPPEEDLKAFELYFEAMRGFEYCEMFVCPVEGVGATLVER